MPQSHKIFYFVAEHSQAIRRTVITWFPAMYDCYGNDGNVIYTKFYVTKRTLNLFRELRTESWGGWGGREGLRKQKNKRKKKRNEKLYFPSWSSRSSGYSSDFLHAIMLLKLFLSPQLNFPFLTLPFSLPAQEQFIFIVPFVHEKWKATSMLPLSLSLSLSPPPALLPNEMPAWLFVETRDINKNYFQLHRREDELNFVLEMLLMWKWFLCSAHSGTQAFPSLHFATPHQPSALLVWVGE